MPGLDLLWRWIRLRFEQAPGDRYRRIRTDFVKDRLRRTPWEQRSYIDDLIALESALTAGTCAASRARVVDDWRWRYRDEYRAIRQEIIDRCLAGRRRLRALAGEDQALEQARAAQNRATECHRQAEAENLRQEMEAWTAQGGLPPDPDVHEPHEMSYRQIRTEFVRDCVRRTRWEERSYIEDLMRIERYTIHGHVNWMDAMRNERLLRCYTLEHEAICDEVLTRGLASAAVLQRLESERRDRQERRRLEVRLADKRKRSEEEQLRRKREEWLSMGGKP